MKTKWSPLTLSQLDEITKYYTKRNQSHTYSKKLKRTVHKTIGIIRRNPFFGELIPNNCRRLTIGNFVLIYQIQDNVIQIFSFRDGRQSIED
ncbi:MAG: type II toxin-antitoxin system RelE/ParE family toxin [Planctomycetaceae bacterium]|nr:type II toxin-antitoxin system RelE/ParE family toxin [Planctomycetaceae bacterium]